MRVIVIEPNNLNIIGDLDQYSYLLWETYYQSPGKFQISCAKGARGSDLLQVGNIVMAIDELRARVGIIGYEDLTLDEEGNERWNKQGYDLSGLLAYRVAINKILDGATGGYDEQTNNAESLMRYYVNVEAINPTDTRRKIPFLTLGNNLNRGEILTYRARLQTLEEIIREIGLVSGLGYQIRLDLENKLFIFEALQGEDKSNVVKLSPNLGNVKSIEYMYDEMTSRNVAIVGGEGEGASRYFVVQEEDVSSSIRREVFVSANDLPDNQLIQKGKETLEEMAEKMTLSCEFIPHGPFELGTDFNLGDFIQVSYPNVAEAIVRVAGIVEEWTREGKRMSLVLGKESQDIKMLLRYYKKLFYATSRR